MQIVTLTSDYGLKDHYLASLKGQIYSMISDVNIVEISSNVMSFNIEQAAYYIESCLDDFPENTIHINVVGAELFLDTKYPENSILPGLLRYKNQYIISFDNGFFNLLLKDNKFDEFWIADKLEIDMDFYKNPVKMMLLPIMFNILNKQNIDKIASKRNSFHRKTSLIPVIETDLIKGCVIHIDYYGNLITNIDLDIFERVGKGFPFTIFFRKKEYYIEKISKTYSDVADGDSVAIFNSNKRLEIGINMGSNDKIGGASKLLGMKVGDIVRIEFLSNGSVDNINELF